jgi:hypothetical protein
MSRSSHRPAYSSLLRHLRSPYVLLVLLLAGVCLSSTHTPGTKASGEKVRAGSRASLAKSPVMRPSVRTSNAANSPVAAITWQVSVGSTGLCTIADPNCASIQAAINAAAADDTINIEAGTYNEHDINLDKRLTLNGASADTTIVEALQLGRVFAINNGATVAISNLKITGGKAADGASYNGDFQPTGGDGAEGGGILNQGTLNLTNCIVSNNRAGNGGRSGNSGSGGSGGGISNTGTLTITNSTVSTNFSGSINGRSDDGTDGSKGGPGGTGGGISNSGELTITDSKVSDNRTGDGGVTTRRSTSDRGGAGGSGGGIFNSGMTTITNSTLSNNQTGNGGNCGIGNGSSAGPGSGGAAGEGGGISNTGGLIITNSTIRNNLTGNGGNALVPASGGSGGIGGSGGGLSNTGTLKIFNVTISDNATGNGGNGSSSNGTGGNGGSGGGINNGNQLTIASSTISSNQTGRGGGGSNGRSPGTAGTGGGINGTANLRNSIVALNSPNDLSAAITDLGHNITGGDPLLGPLQDNGGPTFTRALLNGSPAIDAGDGCVTEITHCNDPDLPQLTTDQRGTGFPRSLDDPLYVNATGSNGIDIGAFEATPRPPMTLNVSPGSTGACTVTDPNCASIQEALAISTTGDTIQLSAGTFPAHNLNISSRLTIKGAGAGNTIIDAQRQGRAFIINSGATLNLSKLKITGGKTSDGTSGRVSTGGNGTPGAEGGGILNRGTLNINNCIISDNRTGNGGDAENDGQLFGSGAAGGTGGGIFNEGTLTLSNTIVSDNQTGNGGTGNAHSGAGGTGGDGGGIFNAGGTASLTITDSTIRNNQTGTGGRGSSGANGGRGGEGAGLYNAGVLTIVNSTINSGQTGSGGNAESFTGGGGGSGGGISNAGTLALFNITISSNKTGNGGNGPTNRANGGNGGNGGGISNTGSLKLLNITISDNLAGNGGNGAPSISDPVFSSPGGKGGNGGMGGGISATAASLRNTIIANNGFGTGGTGGTGNGIVGTDPDVNGTLTSQGHNLIGKSDGTNGFTNDPSCAGLCDKVGSLASQLVPLLGPLQDNGGPTFTRALLGSNSPAFDAGDDCVTQASHCSDPDLPQLTTDQRGTGFPRKSRTHVDIGAFELSSSVTVTVPANQVAEATSAAGAVVTFAPPTAKDSNNISLVATCDHLSGATFPLGITTVQCSATDSASNTGTNSFSVTVQDTTPPTVTLPGNLSAVAPNSSGVNVQFSPSPSAIDLVSGSVIVTCTPTSGSTFAVGTTTVQCLATDAALNTTQGSFNVTVTLGNTAVGSNVTVQPVNTTTNSTPVTLTFQQITAAGNTTLTSGSINLSGLPLPANFKLGSPATFFNISTTASFTPPVKVCVSYSGVTYHDESNIKLLHFNSATPQWDNITIPPVDTVNKIVCGSSPSLSPFVLAEVDQPPIITVPADKTVEATSANGAVVTYAASATDDFDSSVTVSCSKSSGSTFPIGTTTVQCSATDSAGNAAVQKSFKVTVRDTTPPTIAAPANATYQCASQVPVANASQATASDNAGTPVVTFVESNNGGAGSTASPFIITRKFTAKDGAGLSASATQTITVKDTTAPTITLIGGDALNHSMTVEAKTAFVDPGATASDNCTVNLNNAITKTGSVNTNTVGTYTLTYTVNDGHGNSSSITRTVNVVDTTPPTISCLSPITVDATSAIGTVVTYPKPASSDTVSAVTVTCTPASGSTFPIGTTRVQCTAKDVSQNSSYCTFTVTVRGARDIKIDVLNQLIALRASVTDRQDRNRLDDAIKDLTDAVNASLWIDSTHPKPKGGQQVFNKEIDVVNTLRQLIKDKQSKLNDTVLQTLTERLVQADRVLAMIALKEAIDGRGNLFKIVLSGRAFAAGEEDIREKKYGQAIEDYREAWKYALMAMDKL